MKTEKVIIPKMKGAIKQEIEEHIQLLKTLETPRGLFRASAQDAGTGYDKAWLRDNFYTSLAFEAIGDWDTVRRIWRAVLNIFLRHEDKIEWALKHKPYQSWQYIHARYNPETFEEYWEEWGNKQNDAVGAILFKLGDLYVKDHSVVETEDDKRIIQKLVMYLNSIEYWHDPDNGAWEEYEEIHASSVGAAVAGLKRVSAMPFIEIPEALIEKGEQALKNLLPRESESKFCDLSLLSLMYPYEEVGNDRAEEILKNVEYHLEKRQGIIRYKHDRYYNKNKDGFSEEAEWTMGFPWLAIIYQRRNNPEKAQLYLDKARQVLTKDGKLPELYYSNSETPNQNIPLAWAESMFIGALSEIGEM